MESLYECPNCKVRYSFDNPPKKLINCSHNICLSCLKQQPIICPLDRIRIQRRKYSIEAFITNEDILTLLKKAEDEVIHSQIKQKKVKDQTPKMNDNSFIRKKSRTQGEKQNKYAKADQNIKVSQFNEKQPSIRVQKQTNYQNSLYQCNIKSKKQICDQNQKAKSPKKRHLSPKKNISPLKRQLSPKKQKINIQMCLLHSKKAELICLEDKCMICANCGLFGEHKQHKIITYDQFLNKFSILTEQCFINFEELQKRQTKLSLALFQEQVNQLLIEKRKKQLNKIKQHIKSMTNIIRNLQKQLIINLDLIIQYKRNKLLQQINVEQLTVKKQVYMQSVEKMSEGLEDILNHQKIYNYIQFIDPTNQQSYILKQGQYLILEIDNYIKNTHAKILQETEQFANVFQTLNIQMFKTFTSIQSKDLKQINQLIDKNKLSKIKQNTPHKGTTILINKSNKKQEISPTKIRQDLLIEVNSKSGSKQSSNSISYNSVSPIQLPSLEFSKINESNILPSKFNIKINQVSNEKKRQFNHRKTHSNINQSGNYNSYSKKNPVHLNNENDLQQNIRNKSRSKSKYNSSNNATEREIINVLGQKSENKRKRKLDLPEKQTRIYDQLLKDKIEVLDLGRASLGDIKILAISEVFHSCSRLKSVKLMENRITDDIFPELIRSCKYVQSLNLSYNMLTERSLQWLQHEAEYLGELRNITLSMNKIVLRNVKDRLQQLKRRGLNVSL